MLFLELIFNRFYAHALNFSFKSLQVAHALSVSSTFSKMLKKQEKEKQPLVYSSSFLNLSEKKILKMSS